MSTKMWGYRCTNCFTFNEHNDARWQKVDKDEENDRVQVIRKKEETQRLWLSKAKRPIVPCKAISYCELYYLATNLDHYWMRVARMLGFINSEIDDICRQETLHTGRATVMLNKWLGSRTCSNEMIRCTLVEALRRSGQDTLVAAMIILE